MGPMEKRTVKRAVLAIGARLLTMLTINQKENHVHLGEFCFFEVIFKPFRFTWSMKTTSSMDPNDMVKEIIKVNFPKNTVKLYSNRFWAIIIATTKSANNLCSFVCMATVVKTTWSSGKWRCVSALLTEFI